MRTALPLLLCLACQSADSDADPPRIVAAPDAGVQGGKADTPAPDAAIRGAEPDPERGGGAEPDAGPGSGPEDRPRPAESYQPSPPRLVAVGDVHGDFNLMDALAYDAPFPDARYKAGVRRFPALVQVAPGMDGIDHSLRSRAYFTEKWTGESFMALGERDAVLGAAVMEELRSVIRGCPPMLVVPVAGHFVQEYGESIARAALEHFGIA